MTYRLLPAALDDLDALDAWLVTQHGIQVADRVRREFFTVFALLADFPGLGRFRKEVTTKPVRFFSHALHWIAYTEGNPVLVHRIFPGARDLQQVRRETQGF